MKAGKTPKTQTNRTITCDGAFSDLKEAMQDAVAFERRERRNLKVSRIQAPRPPKACHPKTLLAYDKNSTADKPCLR